MTKINLQIEADEAKQEVNKHDGTLKVSLVGVDESELISEVLDNVNIEDLLMKIDTFSMQNEILRRVDEN